MNEYHPRELERVLRDAGLSRKDAVMAVAIFRRTLRDAGPPTEALREAGVEGEAAKAADMLRQLIESLRTEPDRLSNDIPVRNQITRR